MDMADVEYELADLPLPGDPVLRTLIGLVDSGEARGVAATLNVTGQMLHGTLISAADYAAEMDETIRGWRVGNSLYKLQEQLLLAAPDEDDDPLVFRSADYVHLQRSDPMPEVGKRREPQLWRSPIETVCSWSLDR